MMTIIRLKPNYAIEQKLNKIDANLQKIISGLEAFLDAESIVHVKPRILIAPSFSSKKEVLTEMNKTLL